jgi:Domain of unknown function (DUF4872)/Butirosin biosynthesis protein H, N-terminal
MIGAKGFAQFGGRHGESAAIKNALEYQGVKAPHTKKPMSEALCFGIAGGLGAGYSFCPSVPRHGTGGGVSVVSRFLAYATDDSWYQGFCGRIGATTRVTESTSLPKAYRNLVAALETGRPAVVWCARARLPFLGDLVETDLWMHSFLIYSIDEAKGVALASDRAKGPVSLSLDALAQARNGVCSHKNRTLTIEPPASLTKERLATAVVEGIRVCAEGMLTPYIKTFGLPGLETWAKMIANEKSKDGWPNVYSDAMMACALRDVFETIETSCSGAGGLLRDFYADFLDEAGKISNRPKLTELAARYRTLAVQWTELAEAALPDRIAPFRETKQFLRERSSLEDAGGDSVGAPLRAVVERLGRLDAAMRAKPPLKLAATRPLLAELRERIIDLHSAERDAAQTMLGIVA